MSRIVVQTEPTVAPRGVPTPYSTDRAFDAGPGIAQAFDRLGRVAEYGGQKIAKAKQEADTVRVNNLLNELQKNGTDEMYGTPKPDPSTAADAAFDGRDPAQGYLSTRGERATGAGVDTYERLKAKRQALLESTTNPDQKALFENHSDQLLQHWYGQIEGHSAQQREQAKVDSVRNTEAEAIRASALNAADDNVAMANIARVVGVQDALTTSTQDSLVKADAVQSKVTEARLDVLLAQPGGVVDAERVYLANKRVLGSRADEYEKRIESAKLGATAAITANNIVAEAMRATRDRALRPPDPGTAELALARLSPELQAKVAPIVAARMAMLTTAVKQQREEFVDAATSIYNKNPATFFSSDIAHQLNQVDPDKYRALKNEQYHRWRQAGDDSAAARREQAAIDAIAINDFRSLPPDEQASTNIDTFLAGRGVSPKGKSALGPAQAAAKKTVDKGNSEPQQEFVRDAVSNMRAFTTGSKSQVAGEEKNMKAAAAIAFDAFEAEHKRVPTKQEAAKLISDLVTQTQTAPRLGEGIFGKGKERGYQKMLREQKDGAPSSVAPKYKYSPDRKQRVPVLADGSYGTPEPVP